MKTSIIHLAATRVQIKQRSRDCEDILRTFDRIGVTAELLARYTGIDSEIIKLRMELVDGLRKALSEQAVDG